MSCRAARMSIEVARLRAGSNWRWMSRTTWRSISVRRVCIPPDRPLTSHCPTNPRPTPSPRIPTWPPLSYLCSRVASQPTIRSAPIALTLQQARSSRGRWQASRSSRSRAISGSPTKNSGMMTPSTSTGSPWNAGRAQTPLPRRSMSRAVWGQSRCSSALSICVTPPTISCTIISHWGSLPCRRAAPSTSSHSTTSPNPMPRLWTSPGTSPSGRNSSAGCDIPRIGRAMSSAIS